MTVMRLSIVAAVDRWMSALQRRRRRRIAERIMNDLPASLQRDIGWDPASRRRVP